MERRIRGNSWSGALPGLPGELLELRVRAETIAPSDPHSVDGADRRYAGMLSFGLHTQFDWKGNEVSLGADLVVIGPQTGIGSFQSWAHDVMGMDPPQGLDDQLPDAMYPTVVIEAGRSLRLNDRTTVRPFFEMRAGVETLVRVGGDIVLGDLGKVDLMLRDPATGLRYRGVEGSRSTGVSLMLGGDVSEDLGGPVIREFVRQASKQRLGKAHQGKALGIGQAELFEEAFHHAFAAATRAGDGDQFAAPAHGAFADRAGQHALLDERFEERLLIGEFQGVERVPVDRERGEGVRHGNGRTHRKRGKVLRLRCRHGA